MSPHPAAYKPPRLALRFAVYSAIALLLAAVGILWFVRGQVREQAEREVGADASLVAAVLAHHVKASDLAAPVEGARLAALDRAFAGQLSDGVLRVNLWSPQGVLTYSTDHSLIGRRTTARAPIAAALGGARVQEVSTLSDEGAAGAGRRTIDAYVALTAGKGGAGVLQISNDDAPVQADVRETFLPIAFALALTFLLLLAALLPILRQVTKVLHDRNERLVQQTGTLERTLAERQDADRRLRQAESRFRALVEQLPLTTYVTDGASAVTYVSPQIEGLLALPPGEIVGRELWERYVHPDDYERELAAWEAWRAAGEQGVFECEYRLLRADGQAVWVHDSALAIRDRNGRVLWHHGFLLDITAGKEAEAALRESEARFRALVSNVPGAVFRARYDEDWTMEFVSDDVETLTGYPASDFVGNAVRTFASVVHPEDEDGEATVQQALREGHPYSIEYRILRADGQIRWVLERGTGVERSPDGAPLVEGVIFDITDRRQAEERLREAELRFRTLVEQLPLVTFIRGVELRTTNVYVSPQVEEVLGYAPEEWVSDPDLFPRIVHPEDRDRAVTAAERLRRTGEPLSEEYRYIARDGRVVWVLDETQLVRSHTGEPLWVQGYLLDITGRKEAEAGRAQLAALVESSQDAIIGAGLDGTILSWNAGAERMYGYSAAEAVGRSVLMLAAPDAPDEPASLIAHVKKGKAVFEHETVRRRNDGSLVDVSITLSPVRDASGKVVAVSAITKDITDLKEAERELERLLALEREQNARLLELDRLKDEFIALVSHELRTPLTSIRGYLELVLEGETGELTEEQRQFLGVVERNSHRLLHLVGDLLFLAQIEAGKLTLEVGAVDLAGLASDSVETARPLAEERGITLTLASGPVPLLAGDRGRLGQLLDNLISNALKFTSEGGRVDIRTRALGGAAVLEVRDTGMGIPADEQQHLFERFFRSSRAQEAAIPGTGLGLAICKAIVEAHEGDISVTSEEGAGTTFRVSLPLRAAGDVAARQEAIAL